MIYGIKNRPWFSITWAIALVLTLPVLVMILNGVSAGTDTFFHLWQTVLPDYIFNTFVLGIGVTLLSALWGIPSAIFIVNTNIYHKALLRWLLLLPLAMPAYLIAYLYTDLLDYAGPIQISLRQWFGWQSPKDYWFFDMRTLGGASFVISLVLYPYVYMMARGAFEQQDANLLRASRLLGNNHLQSFLKISLPLARPAIGVALGLVLMETLADFATVQYFAVNTLTTAVYDTWLGYGELSTANRIASILLFMVFVVVVWEQNARNKMRHQSGQPNTEHKIINLSPVVRVLATAYCWLLVLLGFLLPLMLLLDMTMANTNFEQITALVPSALNSLNVAVIVATSTIVVALTLVLFRRLYKSKLAIWPQRIAGMGYAIPGTVLAMAILSTFGPIDHFINDFAILVNIEKPGLIFSGTIFAVIFAYVVRFNAIANGAIESGLSQIPKSLDFVPSSLGVNKLYMIRKVHLPLLFKFILVGWLLVFVEAMKELPAVLLLRPFNFETLATHVYQLISDEQLEQGAIGAILIVVFGLIPIIWLNKQKAVSS